MHSKSRYFRWVVTHLGSVSWVVPLLVLSVEWSPFWFCQLSGHPFRFCQLSGHPFRFCQIWKHSVTVHYPAYFIARETSMMVWWRTQTFLYPIPYMQKLYTSNTWGPHSSLTLPTLRLNFSSWSYRNLLSVSPLKHGSPVSNIRATRDTMASWYGLKHNWQLLKGSEVIGSCQTPSCKTQYRGIVISLQTSWSGSSNGGGGGSSGF